VFTAFALHCNPFMLYLIATHTKSPSSPKVRELYELRVKIIIILVIIIRVRFPALPDFLSGSGSGTGHTQPREPREVD